MVVEVDVPNENDGVVVVGFDDVLNAGTGLFTVVVVNAVF